MNTSGCFLISLVLLHNPENNSTSVEFPLLSCMQADIYITEFSKPPSLIFDFRLLTFPDHHQYSTRGMSVPEIVRVADAILLLAIQCRTAVPHAIWRSQFFPILPVFSILASWWVLESFWFYHFVAPSYLGKIINTFPLIPSGCEIAAPGLAGSNFTPPPDG